MRGGRNRPFRSLGLSAGEFGSPMSFHSWNSTRSFWTRVVSSNAGAVGLGSRLVGFGVVVAAVTDAPTFCRASGHFRIAAAAPAGRRLCASSAHAELHISVAVALLAAQDYLFPELELCFSHRTGFVCQLCPHV